MRLAKSSLDVIQTDIGIAERLDPSQTLEMPTIVEGGASFAIRWGQQPLGNEVPNPSSRHIGQFGKLMNRHGGWRCILVFVHNSPVCQQRYVPCANNKRTAQADACVSSRRAI
jgi:hypothetical protein